MIIPMATAIRIIVETSIERESRCARQLTVPECPTYRHNRPAFSKLNAVDPRFFRPHKGARNLRLPKANYC
jgi:hypothetical protein